MKFEDIRKKYGLDSSEDKTKNSNTQTSASHTTMSYEEIRKKYGAGKMTEAEIAKAEVSRKGWEKYLNDLEEEKKSENRYAKKQKEGGGLLDWIGEKLFNSTQDTTFPMAGTSQVQAALSEDGDAKKPSDAWTQEQKNTFGYLYNTDPEKAYQFAIKTNNSINQGIKDKELAKIKENATDSVGSGAANTLGAIGTSVYGLVDFVKDIIDTSVYGESVVDPYVSPFEYSQAVTGGISEHLNDEGGTIDDDVFILGGKGWGDVYGLGTSIVQSAASAFTLGGAGTLISYFGQGAASGFDEAKARGASDDQALLYGTALGTAEGLAEMIGVDNLFKIGASTTGKELVKNVLKQAGAEGVEEGLTSILGNIADNAIMQDKSNFNAMVLMYMNEGMTEEEAKKKAWMKSVEGITYDALGGFVSGGVHGGVSTGVQTAWSNHKAVQQYGEGSGIVAEALGYASEGSELKTLADKYNAKLEGGKKLSGGQINQLNEAMVATDKENIRKNTLKRLGDLGETSDVTPIADALLKQTLGEKLTLAEKKLLNDTNNAHIIAAELDRTNIAKGGLGNDWASNIGTRRVHPEAYNKEFKELYDLAKQKAHILDDEEEDSVARTVAKSETAIGSDYEVSDDGKTKYIDAEGNDSDAVIKQIVSTKGGLKVELEGGTTVNATDLSFGSKEEALMYAMVARMEATTDTANEIIKTFKPKNIQQATAYFAFAPLAYQYGTMNYEAGLKNIKLPDNLKRIAFNRGRADAIAQDKTNTKKPTSKKGSTKIKTTTKENGIIFEDGFVYDESNANELQKASMVGIETIAKMSSLEVHVFESKVENGKRVAYVNGKKVLAPNGYFKDGNKIYIDYAAGNKGEGAMLYTMSHEVTHYIREWNAKGFRELGDFLIAEYGKQGATVTKFLEDQQKKIIDRYKREGKALPSEAKIADMAYEELVADAMSDMLTDPKAYEKLAKLKQKNRSLWEKLGEAIKALLDKLKSALGIYKTEVNKLTVAQEAHEVRRFSAEAYEKLQDLYIKAFVEADANYGATIGTRNLNDLADAKNENGEPLFQYRAMEADEDTYRQMLRNWGKMTDDQVNNLFATIDNAMELIKDNLEILDYAWESDIDDRAFSPVKPNSDKLYQVSLDFSTLCRKRILQQTVQAQLQEALNKPLTREEGIAIRDALIALQEEGRQIEVACALCYVESARMKSPEQIKRFVENREKVIKEFFAGKSGGSIKERIKQAEIDAKAKLHKENPNGIKGKDGTTMLDPRTASLKELPKKYADTIRDAKRKAKESYTPTAEEQKLIEAAKGMTVSDFTSPEGLENLAKNYPALFDAYTSYVRNATKSKGIENDTWWRAGDSMQIGDVLIANMNRENGLRSQSWSDFQVVHILDYIASTIELATRNTKEQAYSKVPDYVELMGNTGVMINMSLIPTASFNGSLDYDSVEGIDYKRALELRDKYHATAGTICIGVDNVQIQLLLADTTIDYVIPYHKSGMAAHIRKAMHIPTWSEYESYQSEKNLSRADAEKQAKKYGVKLLDASDPNYQKGTSFSEWFDMKEAQQIAKMENANPSDKAKQKRYGVMYGGYMAMQNAANNYLKLCAERGISPKFSHEKADFTVEENYWKLLIDRKMVDNVTGEVIEQQTIKPIFNQEEIMRILSDEIARYPKVKADQDYAIRNVTEKMLSGDIKGGMSAKAIAEVMKKPVDNVTNVNILASSEDMKLSDRDSWQNVKSIQGLEGYTVDEVINIAKNHIQNILEEYGEYADIIAVIPYGSRAKGTAKTDSDLDIVVQYDGDIREDDMFNMLNDEDGKLYIDGIEVDINPIRADESGDIEDYLGRVYGFDKYQDAKYSDRDSLGHELSAEQQEFFKDSKVRDKKGNLMVLYHGTTANFSTFKKGDVGFHFGTKGAARGRVGFGKNVTLKEVYLNITNPIVFDEDLGSWDADWRLTRELYDRGILTQEDAESVLFTDDRQYRRTTEKANKKLAEVLLSKGYDGIAYENAFEGKKTSTSYIVFNSNQVKEITNKTPTSDPDIRYSERETLSEAAQKLATISDDKYLTEKKKTPFVLVMDRTPQIILDSMEGSKDRKVLIRRDALYLAIRESGVQDGHYHGLGAETLADLPKYLEEPDVILATMDTATKKENESRRLVLTHIPTKNGQAILSVEFESMKDFEGKYDYFNMVITVFDLHENYLKSLFNKHNAVIKYEKEDLTQVNPQLYKWLKIINVKSSDSSISQNPDFVNREKSDTDVKHSERDSNAISNRTLLANALESVAQNDIEKNKLSQYKAKVALIESEQAKLEKIRAEANALRFTKGRTTAETKKMRDLDAEANQIANRISTWDKQLLNLESTKAIKNVLEREKEMLRKRLGQKEKQAIRAVKERAANTQRELLTRYQESRKNAIEGRHKTEVRHKIKNVVSDLNKLLLNPTKDQHVPIGLQLPVAEALDAINMDTMNAEERVKYYNDLIAKSTDPDEIAMLTKKRDFFEYRDANFKARITALKNAYAEFKESDDPLIRNAHNDAIEDLIKNTADAVGNTSLKDMSLAQLEAVYDMYKAVLATVRNSNKLFKEGRQETVTGNSEAVKTEVKEVGGHKDRVLKMTKFFKQFGWNMLKPITAMKAIGSKTFAKLFDNVRAAEDTWAVDVSEAKQFYEGVSDKYGFKKWDFKKMYTFKDSTGADFSLSLEQIMSLYAYSKREQADKHLEFGGFIFDDAIEITEKNKLGIPLKYEVNDANPYRLRKEDLLTITEALTTEQKAFIDEMQTYLSEVMGAKGNEVSLALYDIKLYKEKNYFPLKTSRYFREFDPEKSGTPKIRNSGFSKKTVPQAGNPIVLANFMDVWASHVNDMSMYHAFVLPLEDFMRVYNYSSTAGGYDSVQQYIKNAYGAQANQYIEKLMDDLNGGARVDSSAGVINKGLSLFKKASVFASASVVVQQPSAIARAFAYINPKYFITSTPSALNLAKHKAKWAEVKKYAPVAVIKEMGYFDTGVGRSTVDWLKGNKNFKDKMDDVLSKAPAIADELAWTHIWEAVKRETAAKKQFKVGSEEFLKECGRRFTEVITNTQVYDSVLARSGMMRSKDTGMKMATAFMAEPTTTVNMMVDGIIQGKRGNKKFTAATVGAVSASIILNSILVALVYAARDDDEDETYTEKYLGSLTSELLDGFNPLTYIPFVKDIWSIAQGYDVERSDMSVVSKLWESVEGLFEEDKSGWEKVLDTTGAVSSLFGIPLKNIIRDAKGMYNLTETILSDTPTTSAGIAESVEDAVTSSIPLYDRLHESDNNADRLYKAILSGDQAQIDRIKGRYKDDKAIESAMRQALREHDSRIKEAAQARIDGNISEYTRIAKEIIAEGNFLQDTVVGAINSEVTAIKKGESTETEATEDKDEATSIYKASDINSAFENGDNAIALTIINDLVNTKVANGMERDKAKSSVRSSMTSHWKPLYKEAYQSGNTSEMERIRRILYSSGLYGKASDVVKTIKAWLKD